MRLLCRQTLRLSGFVFCLTFAVIASAQDALDTPDIQPTLAQPAPETPGTEAPPAGAGNTSKKLEGNIRLQQVFVPETHETKLLEELVRSGPVKKYMTMEREKYLTLVKKLLRAKSQVAPSGARIKHASYHATWERDQLTGIAGLQVETSQEGESFAPLTGNRLAIVSAAWRSTPPSEAQLALTPAGEQVLVVKKTGTVDLAWTLQGQRDEQKAYNFDISLPQAAVTRMTLDLPADYTPQLSAGVVAKAGVDSAKEPDDPVSYATGEPAEGETRWLLLMAPAETVRLTIIPANSEDSRQVTSRTQVQHTITPRGLTYEADIQLDIRGVAPAELVLQTHGELQLTSTRCNGSGRPFAYQDDGRTVVIDLPVIKPGESCSIELHGRAAVSLGNRLKLPSVTLPAASWESESATLRIASPLRAATIEPVRCVQAGFSAAEQSGDGTTYEVHRFVSNVREASVTLQLQQRPAGMKAVCASSIKIGPLSTNATFVAQLSVDAKQLFTTSFNVPREWIVDTASVEPAGVLDDWSITTAGLADQNLHVRLKKPIEPLHSIRVTLQMHRRVRADLLPTSTRLLELADVVDAHQISRTTGVYTSPPFLLQLTNDGGLTRLDQQKLPPGIKAMLDVPDRAIVYEGSSDKARFRLQSESVQYSGELETTVVVNGQILEETHSIRCTPSIAGIASLLVHFAENGPSPIQWRVAGSGATSLVTHQLTEDEQQRANVGAGETYRIDFDRPRRKPFILEGVRAASLKPSQQLPLPSLPSAVSQTGLLLIGVKNGEELTINAGDLRTAPLPIALPGATPVMRAAYVFDPAQTAVVSLEGKPQMRRAVWAWVSETHSRFGIHAASHRIAYKLQNEGEESVAIKLPATARQIAVHVNNNLVQPVSSDGAYVIPLPEGERFPLVTVQFVEPIAHLGKWSQLAPPGVSPAFQVLQHRWTVATAPGYEIQATSPPQDSSAGSIASRIFGRFYAGPDTTENKHSAQRLWRSEAWADASADPRIDTIQRVFGQLWLKTAVTNGKPPLTWQALLKAYEEMRLSQTDLKLPVFEIDSISVHRVAVRPGKSLPLPEAEPESTEASSTRFRDAGAALLKQAGLQLSVAEGSVALVAEPDAHADFEPPAPARMSVATWISAKPYVTSPWTDKPFNAWSSSGWKVQHDVSSTERPAAVSVSQPAFWRAGGWVALFLAATIAIWLLRRAPLWILPLTAIAIVVAVAAPGVVAPITTGICLGCITATLVLAIHTCIEDTRKHRTPADESPGEQEIPADSEESQTATASFRASGLLVLIALSSLYAQLHAAETGPGVIDYKVVIPVDEDEKPAGHVFVPKPVFDRMLTLESDDASTGYSWLITRTDYTCQISRTATGDALQISGCTARLQMVVRRRGARIKLPFSSRQLDLLPGSVKIDGAEAEFAWSRGGDSLEIETTEAGVQELSIAFIPRISSVADRHSLGINIPPAPMAELRVKTVEDLDSLEIASALGTTRLDTTSGDLLIALGPANQLQMSWLSHNETTTLQPAAKQLVWLQIQPKSVLCRTATTIVAPQSKAIRTLEFEVDARLQITAGRSANISSIMVSPQPSAAGMKRVSLLLDRDYQGEEFSIHVSYLVTGATGIGVTRPPRIEISGCRKLRQWFAISMDTGLEHSIEGAGQLPPQSASAFKAAWQQAGAPLLTLATPDVAYAAMPAEQQYQVISSPPGDPFSATVREILLAGSEKIDYEALIEIEADDARNFHHAFSDLGRVLIHEATMLKEGASTPLEFALSENGQLSVFSEDPLSGKYTIRLRGELRKGKKFTRRTIWHTMLQCRNALVDQQYIDLYGYYDAVIATKQLLKLEPNLEDTQPAMVGNARITGRWKVQASAGGSPSLPRINFEISPNRPRAECHRLVRLDRVDGNWHAAMRCQGTVSRGQMDRLRIEFSPQWAAPFQCDPPAKITLEPVPGSDRSRMHLEFEKPLKGAFNIRVTGSLNPASGERIAAPVIEPLDMVRVERRLLLPMRAQEQLFNWKTGGLIKDPLPAIFHDEIPRDPTAAYRVVGSQPTAEIVDVENIRGTPQVWLSDVHLQWSNDGHATGVASFDLEPGGLDTFDVRLPVGWRLISIHVGAAPVLIEKSGENQFRITSALRQLPQRIIVVFEAQLKHSGGGWMVEPPELDGIPVARQLWTIYGPDGAIQTVTESGKRYDARQQEIFRHKAICNVIDGAADTLGESNPRDVARWHPAWVKRLVQSRNRFKRLPDDSGDTVDPLEVDHLAVAERLERWAGDISSWSVPPVAGTPTDVFTMQHRGQTPVRLAFRGATTGFSVQQHQPSSSWMQNVLPAVLVAVALGVVWWLLRMPVVAAIAMRSRYVLGVFLGILWWLLLTPAFAGLTFAALCLMAAAMHRAGRGSNLQQPGTASANS